MKPGTLIVLFDGHLGLICPTSKAVVKKLLLLFLCLDVIILSVIYAREFCVFMPPSHSGGTITESEELGGPATIQLRHRLFTIFEFRAMGDKPKGLVLFASGDGGWLSWEESVCRNLQAHGYSVIGIDSADYAKTDYDLETIQADYDTIARKGLDAYKSSPPPVIVGGWSMGAAQAVAVAGGPTPPRGLIGLLLISPSSRGRYGLRVSDRVDILPTGPGTFAVEDFASALNGLRIVQWHAGDDNVDSTAWLAGLKAPHREYDYPHIGHDYGYANPIFLGRVVESVNWIIDPSQNP